MIRVYCDGALKRAQLDAKLDEGYVLVDLVRRGQGGKNDVAYFRPGTPEEIAACRAQQATRTTDRVDA